MNELAIIINKNGEYITFGTWVPVDLQDNENYSHFHNKSFTYDVYNTEWFNNLQLPYNPNEIFTAQLDIFAQYGNIVILNIKKETNKVASPALQITSPERITPEQYTTMDNLKEKLITWADSNYSYIDIINENGEYTLDNFDNINDYYEYLGNNKNKSR